MHFIAYTVKGLEEVAAAEIGRRVKDAQGMEQAPKRVVFEAPLRGNLTALHIADDIGLLLGHIQVTTAPEIVEFISSLDLLAARQTIAALRVVPELSFSLTATLAGTAGFKSDDLITELAKVIEGRYHWTYTERDHSNFDIRVLADHNDVYVAVRLLPRSLHERVYKTAQRPGSLRPSIAAAMVELAVGGGTGKRIIDNFCGSGTILAEALLAKRQVYGGDIEPEAVSFTRQNLANLHYKETDRIVQLDATKTKWPSRFFDAAISNLPWGKQIEISHITALYRDTLREYSRVLKPGGDLCLLVGSKPELLAKHAKLIFPGAVIQTHQLGYLGQAPTIMLIKRH